VEAINENSYFQLHEKLDAKKIAASACTKRKPHRGGAMSPEPHKEDKGIQIFKVMSKIKIFVM